MNAELTNICTEFNYMVQKNREKKIFVDGAIRLCVFKVKRKYIKFESNHNGNVISSIIFFNFDLQ